MIFKLNSSPSLRADVGLCLLITLHVLAAYFMSLSVGGTQWFNVKGSAIAFAYIATFYASICLVYGLLKGLITRDVRSALASFFNVQLLRGVIVFTFIGMMLGAFHSIKIMMPEIAPFTWDTVFADIDKAIHFNDPWRYLTALDGYYFQILFFYASVWLTLHILTTFFVSISNLKVRSQYLYTYVTTWIVCGNVLPMLFMAVGPVYYERLTGSTRFKELSDRIFASANENNIHSNIPDTLWQAYIAKDPFTGSGISAFPSLHVAMSTLLCLIAFRLNKALGLVGLCFLLFTMIASVNLAWHYAIDGYASIILVLLIWSFWGRVFRGDKAAS